MLAQFRKIPIRANKNITILNYFRVSREMGNTAFRLLLSRKSNNPKKRLTFFSPHKSGIRKNRFPTAFFACFSVILSRKMKIADFRLTFSKKEFQNGAICKSFFAISTFATYLPHHTARKALDHSLPYSKSTGPQLVLPVLHKRISEGICLETATLFSARK
jgi:hypothetical protein